jgi:hypothetical protein
VFVKIIRPILSVAALCALLIMPATVNALQHEVVIPKGTVVHVRMIDSIDSEQNRAGQVFRGSLENPIRINNQTVLPRGSTAFVKLVEAKSAGRVKGRSELSLQLDRIAVGNHTYLVRSDIVNFRGKSQGKRTAKSAGIGAAVGGGLGALFGGGKGAAIGAGLGAGTGAATRAVPGGEQIRVNSESLVQFRLTAPLHVRFG